MKKVDMAYIHDLLAKIDDKLDDMDSKLHNLDKTTVLQQVSLDEHIRRTNILESELKPIKEHVDSVRKVSTFVFKLVSAIAVIAGIWASLRS